MLRDIQYMYHVTATFVISYYSIAKPAKSAKAAKAAKPGQARQP